MAETEPYTEYGLQLPIGAVHWGSALGRPIGTQDERTVMVLVLRKTAQEVGWPEQEFVNRYRWVSRTIQHHDVNYEINDATVAPPVNVTQESAAESFNGQ